MLQTIEILRLPSSVHKRYIDPLFEGTPLYVGRIIETDVTHREEQGLSFRLDQQPSYDYYRQFTIERYGKWFKILSPLELLALEAE